jgi:hypothetical protein
MTIDSQIFFISRGYLCEFNLQDFNSCKNKPCQNFGFCTPQGNCICPSTHTGKFCETLLPTTVRPLTTTTTTTITTTVTTAPIDFCRTIVCQNNGICITLGPGQGFCNCK